MAAVIAGDQEDQKKIVEVFQKLREEQQELASEVTKILEEKREFSRVINLLKELEPSQTCFRLISDTLVEQKISNVLPTLETNLANLETLTTDLNSRLVEKGKALNEHKSKHNIRFLTQEESQKLQQEMAMKQMAEQQKK